ncbi:MAG: hypothetical protein U9N42_06720 [Campylobacterota bacterium]|nr:hypothetical protein [Campylobacterota bacterium]
MFKIVMALLFVSSLSAFDVQNGIEDGYAKYKSDACDRAKEQAYEKHNILNMDVGCSCEKDDSRQWMCVVKYEYVKSKK